MLLSLWPQLLPNKTWDIWEELTHLMSSEDNFRVFREALHKINPPCIPYLGTRSAANQWSPIDEAVRALTCVCSTGVFLTDLTFIEDGNPDFLRPDLINITKLRYVSPAGGQHICRTLDSHE